MPGSESDPLVPLENRRSFCRPVPVVPFLLYLGFSCHSGFSCCPVLDTFIIPWFFWHSLFFLDFFGYLVGHDVEKTEGDEQFLIRFLGVTEFQVSVRLGTTVIRRWLVDDNFR